MLQLPRVPPVVKGFHFEGVEAHQLRQTLAAEIRETIEALIKSTYVPGWQSVLYKFRDCVEPGQVRDPARLPYPVAGPNDTAGTKIGCIYARLSWVIQAFWSLCLDNATENAPRIRGYLEGLHEIAACGIDRCRIEGDVRHGYWLEVPDVKAHP